MSPTKKASSKGGGGAAKGGSKKGAASKGGAKKGGAKKGGAKKGASKRGLGSVLANIGNIAGTVGGIAGTVGSLTGASKRELRVGVPSNARFNDITRALKRKFTEFGCGECKSGINKITFEDIINPGG